MKTEATPPGAGGNEIGTTTADMAEEEGAEIMAEEEDIKKEEEGVVPLVNITMTHIVMATVVGMVEVVTVTTTNLNEDEEVEVEEEVIITKKTTIAHRDLHREALVEGGGEDHTVAEAAVAVDDPFQEEEEGEDMKAVVSTDIPVVVEEGKSTRETMTVTWRTQGDERQKMTTMDENIMEDETITEELEKWTTTRGPPDTIAALQVLDFTTIWRRALPEVVLTTTAISVEEEEEEEGITTRGTNLTKATVPGPLTSSLTHLITNSKLTATKNSIESVLK